jgi:hypothetical protein
VAAAAAGQLLASFLGRFAEVRACLERIDRAVHAPPHTLHTLCAQRNKSGRGAYGAGRGGRRRVFAAGKDGGSTERQVRHTLKHTRRRRKSVTVCLGAQAYSEVVQGSASDLIKTAMVRVDRRLRAAGLQARIVLQIHDEVEPNPISNTHSYTCVF